MKRFVVLALIWLMLAGQYSLRGCGTFWNAFVDVSDAISRQEDITTELYTHRYIDSSYGDWTAMCRAANEGDPKAQNDFAQYLWWGGYLRDDPEHTAIQAYIFASLAASNGYESAEELRATASMTMRRAWLEKAERRLQEWQPDPSICE